MRNITYDRLFYYSGLLFAFTLPLSRAAVSFFVLWFIVLFLIKKEYRYTWELIKSNHVFWAMGALISFLALSLLWTENIPNGMNQLRLYSYWIIIPILGFHIKREWLPNIITAFLLGMFISEIVAYGIYFEWWTFKDRTPDYPSPFMFHIHYSIFLATTSIILLSRILSKHYTWRSKLPMFLFFLTATGNLMISTGRTGQLAFLVAIAIAVILHFRFTLKAFLIFVTISSVIFIGAYKNIDLFQKRINTAISDIQEYQRGNFNTSWGLRAAFWLVTYDIIREHPLIGAGIGDYKIAAAEVLNKYDHQFSSETIAWCKSTDFHNQYLMILGQIGLIGFVLMIWLFVELFRLKITDLELKEFNILGVTIFMISCISESLWTLQFPIILFIFIVSISIAASNKDDKVSLV